MTAEEVLEELAVTSLFVTFEKEYWNRISPAINAGINGECCILRMYLSAVNPGIMVGLGTFNPNKEITSPEAEGEPLVILGMQVNNQEFLFHTIPLNNLTQLMKGFHFLMKPSLLTDLMDLMGKHNDTRDL